MINIIIPCTPNYQKRKIINTVGKKIDMVSQFILLYNSIKKNWNFDYRVNLFHNRSIDFNLMDKKRLSDLDIDIYGVDPDTSCNPYMVRCNGLTHELKNKSTHRLLLDCDTIALSEPSFNLKVDWQAMFANSVIDKKFYENINKKYGYNLNLKNKVQGRLFQKYMKGEDFKDFFPHFNAGAILIKEELSAEFKRYTNPSYEIVKDKSAPHYVRHIGVQYGASFALMKISDNWQPFDRGFNYLIKEYDLNDFGKENIQLLHYCGIGAYQVAYKNFKREIDFLKGVK